MRYEQIFFFIMLFHRALFSVLNCTNTAKIHTGFVSLTEGNVRVVHKLTL